MKQQDLFLLFVFLSFTKSFLTSSLSSQSPFARAHVSISSKQWDFWSTRASYILFLKYSWATCMPALPCLQQHICAVWRSIKAWAQGTCSITAPSHSPKDHVRAKKNTCFRPTGHACWDRDMLFLHPDTCPSLSRNDPEPHWTWNPPSHKHPGWKFNKRACSVGWVLWDCWWF